MELTMEISSRQDILNVLSQCINKLNHTPKHSEDSSSIIITEDTILQSIGLDSLDIIELQLMYEECSNTVVNEPTSAIITIRDLINLLE